MSHKGVGSASSMTKFKLQWHKSLALSIPATRDHRFITHEKSDERPQFGDLTLFWRYSLESGLFMTRRPLILYCINRVERAPCNENNENLTEWKVCIGKLRDTELGQISSQLRVSIYAAIFNNFEVGVEV